MISVINEVRNCERATRMGPITASAKHTSRARYVILRPGDVLILGTVRPGNGSYALVDEGGLTGSTGFAVLRPTQPSYRELVYLASTTTENIERLSRRADGAAYPAVLPKVVAETNVALPSNQSNVLDRFSETSAPIVDKIESMKRQSRTLAAQRDALLPGLVSGELPF